MVLAICLIVLIAVVFVCFIILELPWCTDISFWKLMMIGIINMFGVVRIGQVTCAYVKVVAPNIDVKG